MPLLSGRSSGGQRNADLFLYAHRGGRREEGGGETDNAIMVASWWRLLRFPLFSPDGIGSAHWDPDGRDGGA